MKIEFVAEIVEIIDDPLGSIRGLHLGEGDPERGGEHWNFTEMVPRDTDPLFAGVCTVKEIQHCTVYGGITRFDITPSSLHCTFDSRAAGKTGISDLLVTFSVIPEDWIRMKAVVEYLFEDADCLTITDSGT